MNVMLVLIGEVYKLNSEIKKQALSGLFCFLAS